MNILAKLSLIAPAALFASSAMAVNVLQIGPTAGDAGAFYGTCDTGGDPSTWCLGTDAFNVYLLDSSSQEPTVDNNDTVFLVFSAIPKSLDALLIVAWVPPPSVIAMTSRRTVSLIPTSKSMR